MNYRQGILLLGCVALLGGCAHAAEGPMATPVSSLKIAAGFQVERLYSVPKDKLGSWVSMCVDGRGRLIVCDQHGGLFRVTPPAIGAAVPENNIKIEKIDVAIGEAQGLLWAFDSLYVVVNRGGKYDNGLYRVRDTNGDDQLDELELLRQLPPGRGEHGPHAVLLSPDGKSLRVVVGNQSALTEIVDSRVPQLWDEDELLPRVYGRGFMKEVEAPRGFVYEVDPEGKRWTLVASGFRNQYDAAFNADGELFAYDADMEWDMNTPWYRPTRVCHTVSGAEFGWRNGSAKWPAYYPDSLPATLDVGPGSPTGVVFGYGAKFPAKYQKALFICDWSYGKLYAVHLEPKGSTYSATLEEFVTGTPLPLTDIVIAPDSAMYFTTGGRKVQSGFYRVTYTGDESTAAVDAKDRAGRQQRALRHKLELLNVGDHPDAVAIAWPYLNHDDRFISYAARVAIESRPVAEWRQKALDEKDPQASLTALIALARQFKSTYQTRGQEIDPPPPNWNEELKEEHRERAQARASILQSLARLPWKSLTDTQRIALLRAYALAFLRIGQPTAAERTALIERLEPLLPADTYEVNAELAELLVYLQAAAATPKIVELLQQAPTQEQQIDFAKTLRFACEGWTPELRNSYFEWFVRAAGYKGGASFVMFVDEIKKHAVSQLSLEEQKTLAPILNSRPTAAVTAVDLEPRPLVKQWTLEELDALVKNGLKNRDFERGRKMFAAANCFACHRFDNQGGAVGPDLTSLAGRFGARDILESIVEPSKQISDQYAAVTIITTDGKSVTGRIVNLAGDDYRVNTNMLNPDEQAVINVNLIDEIIPSKLSMMPEGLLNTLQEEEICDLLAYLLSRGDRNNPMFITRE